MDQFIINEKCNRKENGASSVTHVLPQKKDQASCIWPQFCLPIVPGPSEEKPSQSVFLNDILIKF